MVQIVKGTKKKGRPSKADLAHRAVPPAPLGSPDRRRSMRRRIVRYSLNLDEDEFEGDYVDEDDREEEEEEERRREKKLKLVQLQLSPHGDEDRGVRQRMGGSGAHAPPSVSASPSEGTPVKKRRIGGDGDCNCEGDDVNEDDESDDEDKARNRDSRGVDSVPGTPTDPPFGVRLPDKKSLEIILDKLQKKDIYGVYADPVDPEELPDYHDIIEHPMDFATVRKKLGDGSYHSLEQFESDVFLICSNAMQYNTPETIYYKQACSIQELARKKFERLRIETTELNSEQKKKPNLLPKRQIKKPICRISQEPVGSDFSSGTILATGGDAHNGLNMTNTGCERLNNTDGVMEGNSSQADTNLEKAEEPYPGKAPCKFGKKPSLTDDNRRVTYNMHDQPTVRSQPVFSVFEGENKQLVPVGLHAEYSYAKSLARFSATLGPIAWKVACERIEQVLPTGIKFGRGWVGEYEPLPTTVLKLESRAPREPAEPITRMDNRTANSHRAACSVSHGGMQQHFLSPGEPKTKISKQVELNCTALANQNMPSKPQPLCHSPVSAEEASRNVNLLQIATVKQRGVVNGELRDNLDNGGMAIPPATHFPHGNGLGDPAQRMMKPPAMNEQKPSWMSVGARGFPPNGESLLVHDNQISADSLYTSTRESPSQTVRPMLGKNGIQFQAFVPQQRQLGGVVSHGAEFQNRALGFPQLVSSEVYRFQVQQQGGLRGASPRNPRRQPQEAFPPDLNIGFPPSGSPAKQGASGVLVCSQQPDLALQL